MEFIRKIVENGRKHPERIAYRLALAGPEGALTWGELIRQSGRLAGWMEANLRSHEPVVVYGHKAPDMIVSFLACIRSGRGYCPIDTSVPADRARAIVDDLQPELILMPEAAYGEEAQTVTEGRRTLSGAAIREQSAGCPEEIPETLALKPEEVCYLIYTSGSTGTPKGVQITAQCLQNFIHWGMTLGAGISEAEADAGITFLNQAPFSFDLSVMDLYLFLYSGGTLYALPKSVQGDAAALMKALRESDVQFWVSTPSFAEVCLADPGFGREAMHRMQRFAFCGETLPPATVRRLMQAFPGAEIVNTYGPTESTVAVTDVTVTEDILEKWDPLPVGSAKPGTQIRILGEDGAYLPEGERGEVIIIGDTVSPGYRNNPEKTQKAFFTVTEGGETLRAYHTGDKGYLLEGQLFYCGRIDLQIKLHGYRIELEDIENNLNKLENVERAAVLPKEKDGVIRSLTAYVLPVEKPENAFAAAQELRAQAKKYLPDYMIPKKIVFVDEMPMTTNGKVDRRSLGQDR